MIGTLFLYVKRNSMTSVSTALHGLSLFISEPRPWGVREFAERAGLAPSNAHRILVALKQAGYLTQDAQGRTYSLGIRALELGEAFRRSVNLDAQVQKLLDETARSTGESIYLSFRDGGEVICTQRALGTSGLQLQIAVGERTSIFRGSRGRLLLAYVDPSERKALFDAAVPVDGAADPRELNDADSLAAIVEHGYCFSVGERLDGVAGVSAPLRQKGSVNAAVTIGGPVDRFTADAVADHVTTAKALAAQLEGRLNHA